jgi:hypothetical protein
MDNKSKMSAQFKTKIQQEVWQVIKDLNDTWVRGNPADLDNFFHKDMVIVHSDFKERGEGKEICIQSYKDFTSQAVIQDFKEFNPNIDVHGNTAIATYTFDITYEMSQQTFHDTGRDLFVLVQEENKWQAVWRTILPYIPENQK